LSAEAIIASEPLLERRQYIHSEIGVACQTDNLAAAACRRVVLAVKPQSIGRVLDEIAPAVKPDTTVISIAAGISTSVLDDRLGGSGCIVRVMPNTPMLVGCGISAICAGPRARQEDLDFTQSLFAASGSTVLVDEQMMDAVTAVSGSGPAYFFYLVEAMIAAGVAEGLSNEVAALLATQTCIGAGKLLAESGQPPEELRERVTSPGGTTQRAIETLEACRVTEALVRAVRAAAERSRQLAK